MSDFNGQHGSLFESQAQEYAIYRPGYPRHVYEAIYSFAGLADKGLAVDIGCGTGQVAVGLAEDFRRVIGLDSSRGQIEHAAARPNISYRVAPAEATGVARQSADLVTAAQCMHWFDVPAFYRECRRIVKPSGALAVFGYMPNHVHFPSSPEAGEVLCRLHSRLHTYFHENRQHFLLHHYEGQEPTPEEFRVVMTTVIDMERQMSVKQLVGWIRSMSCWPAYVAQHGEEGKAAVLQGLRDELMAALGVEDEAAPVTSVWPLTVILAKDPVPL